MHDVRNSDILFDDCDLGFQDHYTGRAFIGKPIAPGNAESIVK